MAIQRIAVLGGGQMGAGITEAAAVHGVAVTLIKATPGPSFKARTGIEKNLKRLIEKGKMTETDADKALGRMTFTDDLGAAAEADLFIESIIEDLETKKRKFAEVDRIAKREAILASNTSTLSISAMQQATVEVIPTSTTDAGVTADLVTFVEQIGKTPVLVKDATGFIVNRLLTPYMCDAIRAFESGLADVSGIDTAMQLGANHPMGPLALADYIGLDIVCAMAENLHESFGKEYMAPPALLKKLVAEGHLGRKTNLGFYDYAPRPPVPNRELEPRR
jgi:3-hydroxybutyryl-CoA dehydrogenase